MTDPAIATLAEAVDTAAMKAEAIRQISESTPISPEQGYDIQAASILRRVQRGERRIGVKMGFTSRAKMVQMGISDMIWGRLTDGMIVEDGDSISMADYVHPRAEPEIAFLLGRPLEAPVTAAEAMAAVEAVAPAIEIIDSRYRDFKFSLADVVADNCSSSGIVVGAWQSVDADLTNLGMILEVDGRPRQIGSLGRDPRQPGALAGRRGAAFDRRRRTAGGGLDRHGGRRHRGRGALGRRPRAQHCPAPRHGRVFRHRVMAAGSIFAMRHRTFLLTLALLLAAFGAQPLPAQALPADTLKSVVSVLPVWPGRPQGGTGGRPGVAPEGSGVVLRPGHIATAWHVVKPARRIDIRLSDGRILPARLIARDEASDIAVLGVDAALPPIGIAPAPRLAQPVCAVGNAYGLGLSVTCGVVSALNVSNAGFNPVEDFVQTDAASNPGVSGGALVDSEGRLVGMMSAIFASGSDTNIGVNFATLDRAAAPGRGRADLRRRGALPLARLAAGGGRARTAGEDRGADGPRGERRRSGGPGGHRARRRDPEDRRAPGPHAARRDRRARRGSRPRRAARRDPAARRTAAHRRPVFRCGAEGAGRANRP